MATSDIALFMAHPFVVMLKPAVAMSAQPDITVVAVSLIETLLSFVPDYGLLKICDMNRRCINMSFIELLKIEFAKVK